MDKLAILLKLANDVNDPSKFDESVPPVEQNQQSEGGDDQSPIKPQQDPNQQEQPGEEEYAATPDEGQEEEGGDTPEAVGARAAQAFLGPEVMQMALQGDQAAADLISRTAGHIASSMANAFVQSQNGGQGGDPSQGGQMGQPEPQLNDTTPEDDLAASIAPTPNEALASSEGGTSDRPATQQ